MERYRKTSHVVYECKYHFVWVPKYRFRVLEGDVREGLRRILEQLCNWKEVVILEGAIQRDHVHLYLSVPPKMSPSEVMKVLKGKSAAMLIKQFPELRKRYWGMHLWARGYFVSTSGVDERTIREYIQRQEEEEYREEQLRLWRE